MDTDSDRDIRPRTFWKIRVKVVIERKEGKQLTKKDRVGQREM